MALNGFKQIKDKKLVARFNELLKILQQEIDQSEASARIKKILLQFDKKADSTAFFDKDEEVKLNIVEVEDKYRVIEIEELQKEIHRQGFKLDKEIIQQDTYYDIEDHLQKLGQALRVRKGYTTSNEFIDGELKWEGKRGSIQDRPVYEIEVLSEENLAELANMLERDVGFKPDIHFRKKRFLYKRNEPSGQETQIELDLFLDKDNPQNIKGKVYVQIAQEVEPDKREQALDEVQKISSGFDLEKDNRDYIEIAARMKRN